LAVSLLAWLRHIGFKGDLAKAEPKMLRYRIFSAPARLVTHARKKILKVPPGWTWSTDLATAWQRIHALHPSPRQHSPGRPVEPAPTRARRASPHALQ
jgi:hypothetical protein